MSSLRFLCVLSVSALKILPASQRRIRIDLRRPSSRQHPYRQPNRGQPHPLPYHQPQRKLSARGIIPTATEQSPQHFIFSIPRNPLCQKYLASSGLPPPPATRTPMPYHQIRREAAPPHRNRGQNGTRVAHFFESPANNSFTFNEFFRRRGTCVSRFTPLRPLNVLRRELRLQRLAQPRHRVPQIRPRRLECGARPIPHHPVDPSRIVPQPDQPRL